MSAGLEAITASYLPFELFRCFVNRFQVSELDLDEESSFSCLLLKFLDASCGFLFAPSENVYFGSFFQKNLMTVAVKKKILETEIDHCIP
jgi:hypothetical protein